MEIRDLYQIIEENVGKHLVYKFSNAIFNEYREDGQEIKHHDFKNIFYIFDGQGFRFLFSRTHNIPIHFNVPYIKKYRIHNGNLKIYLDSIEKKTDIIGFEIIKAGDLELVDDYPKKKVCK